MNDREDWHNRNPYMEQFICPVSGIPPAFGVSPNNWVHVPPQTMPWGVPAGSQPPVVRFTAGDFNTHSVPVKRKIDSSMDFPPTKMLVTEEKMAAHLRGLHISDVDPPDVSMNIGCKEESMETERLPRLVISDEIKNLKTESIIPESILKKLEKPEMALVLWQPPANDLDSKLKELKKLSLKKEKDKDKEGDMDVTIEAEMESKTADSVFRPIDPVPMPTVQNQFLQPVPQFHGYTPFSQNPGNNFSTKFS